MGLRWRLSAERLARGACCSAKLGHGEVGGGARPRHLLRLHAAVQEDWGEVTQTGGGVGIAGGNRQQQATNDQEDKSRGRRGSAGGRSG